MMVGYEGYLFGHATSFIRLIENLIVEHWEIQSQTQSYWVSWSQIRSRYVLPNKITTQNFRFQFPINTRLQKLIPNCSQSHYILTDSRFQFCVLQNSNCNFTFTCKPKIINTRTSKIETQLHSHSHWFKVSIMYFTNFKLCLYFLLTSPNP
jgi:hypothetical protein